MELAKEFEVDRLSTTAVLFHHKIPRNVNKSFFSSKRQVQTKKGNVQKSIEVNRGFLGSLVSFSLKSWGPIDYKEALKYPLSAVPLSISHADGIRRKGKKSELANIILESKTPDNRQPPSNSSSAYVVDLMAAVRTVVHIPDTFENLTWKLLKTIPVGYKRIDIVADAYREISLKFAERVQRGISSKVMIRSPKSKVPRDFKAFLNNGDNKTKMIEIMFQVIIDCKAKVLNLLRTSELLLSKENYYKSISLLAVKDVPELQTNQEEADTRVILHTLHIASSDADISTTLRSPSGDTDILVLAVSLLHQFKDRVYLDNGIGSNRRVIWLGSIDFSEQRRKALIGFHAFTGNDYTPDFFRKTKTKCWKLMLNHNQFEECFAILGDTSHLSVNSFRLLEHFVSLVYGGNDEGVNQLRYQIFTKKQAREKKVVDLANLPPCQSVLHLHSMRANTVAYIWRNSGSSQCEIPPLSECGWSNDGQIIWIESALPSDVEDLLFEEGYDEDVYEYGSDVDSEDDFN